MLLYQEGIGWYRGCAAVLVQYCVIYCDVLGILHGIMNDVMNDRFSLRL